MKNEKSKYATFSSAYSIKGKGVGHLELSKAVKSTEFTAATKSLAQKIQAKYVDKHKATC